MLAAWIFGPGFFSSQPVHVALAVGGIAAAVSGVVGIFTVMRGQAFAGHALSDVGTTGGSAATLLGVSPLFGFVAMNVVAAGVMETIGIRRRKGRDLATGIVLGAALGLAAVFLYLDTTASSTTGVTVNILFGSIFTLPPAIIGVVGAFAAIAMALVGVLYRPLILSSLSEELAGARGVPVRLVGLGYLLALAIGVSLSAVTTGAILSTALLVGPPAAALRLTKRSGWAILAAVAIGVAITWTSVLLSYDSYYWTAVHQGWPVSFFVVTLVLGTYLLAGFSRPRRRHS